MRRAEQRHAADAVDRALEGRRIDIEGGGDGAGVTGHECNGEASERQPGIVREQRFGAIPARPADVSGAEREPEHPSAPLVAVALRHLDVGEELRP